MTWYKKHKAQKLTDEKTIYLQTSTCLQATSDNRAKVVYRIFNELIIVKE